MYCFYSAPANYRVVHLVIFLPMILRPSLSRGSVAKGLTEEPSFWIYILGEVTSDDDDEEEDWYDDDDG